MKYYFLIVIMLTCSLVRAQDAPNPIATDRPGASSSPGTVNTGIVQIETGAAFTSFKENNIETRSYNYNNTLLRYGIFTNFELRLTTNFQEDRTLVNNEELANLASGFSPLGLGFKALLKEEKGIFPEIGLIGNLNLPFFASTDYKPETTGAEMIFLMSHTLSEKSNLTYNIGGQWGNDSPEVAYLYTLNYGYTISHKLSAFGELYGNFPENSQANHLWDVGIIYLISTNFQADVSAGTSVTGGQDLFLSVGLSYRIPK